MKKYFFIDYDNTIFSHKTGRIPPSALTALKKLHQDGHKLFIASGRGFSLDAPELLPLGFVPDGLVSANGAFVEVGGKLLRKVYFDRELQNRLIDYVQEKNYCLMGHYDNLWYASNIPLLRERVPDFESKVPLCTESSFDVLRDKPMLSFFLEDTEEAVRDLEAHFPDLKLLRMRAQAGGADVIPKENGKAHGMSCVLEHYGASLKDAVAIGDSMNDIEMIQAAGLGIAIGNAMTDVKAAANYVARDIDEDGLMDAVTYSLGKGLL